MNTVTKLLSVAALASLFGAAPPPAAQAQFPAGPGVYSPPPGVQFAPPGGGQYYNPNNPSGSGPNGRGRNGGGGQGQGQGQGQQQLPDGVQTLIANQGTNEIIALATREGYEKVRELVRIIDGQLDIIRTEIKQVSVSADDLKALGLPTDTSGVPLSDADAGKVLGAVKAGALRTSGLLRVTTREATPVDTLLTARTGGGSSTTGTQTPLSFVAREDKDGALSLEIFQPARTQRSVGPGGSVVLPLPGQTTGGVTFLVLTPSIQPSEHRPAR